MPKACPYIQAILTHRLSLKTNGWFNMPKACPYIQAILTHRLSLKTNGLDNRVCQIAEF